MSNMKSCSVVENAKGLLEIIPGDDVPALSWGSWTFRWQPAFNVQPGGGLEIILVPRFPTNRWSLPQVYDPIAPGFVTARAGKDVLATVEIVRWPAMHKPHGATLHIIQVALGGRTVKAGETIEVTYGDRRGGSLGVQAQLSAREVSFPVFVSSGQEPKFLERFSAWQRATDVATLREQADFNPSLSVVGGPAAMFHVVAPMEVDPGAPFDLRLAVMDASCNAASGYEGVVELYADDPGAGSFEPAKISGARAVIGNISLHKPGFHRIHAVDLNNRLLGVSNPIRVRKGAGKILWGELHGHSELSDGNGTPDEHYSYARDTALLDFACVTDHDKHLYAHPDRWRTAIAKAREHTREGSFVALLGYEGRMKSPDGKEWHGDINVYYRGAEGEILAPFQAPLKPEKPMGKDLILIPHTPLYGPEAGMGTHWEHLKATPPDVMPLVEIYSTHGNSEYLDCPRHVLWQAPGQGVVDALKKGFRLGLIGSSDYHEVLTGNPLRIQDTPRTVNNRHMQSRCGLAAVRADGLTRAAIFEALQARRTFATSGIRGYVDFSVNGHEMGTEFAMDRPDTPRLIQVAAAAPERMARIEIIRNGDIVHDLADGNWFFEGGWEDETPVTEEVFYYLRITTGRDEFIWSSPVWVNCRKK